MITTGVESTGLDELFKHTFNEIYVVGIATEVCVLNTLYDARATVVYNSINLIEDACASLTEKSRKEAIDYFKILGVNILQSTNIIGDN